MEDENNFELVEDDHEFIMSDGMLHIDGHEVDQKQTTVYKKARNAWRAQQ